MRNQVEGQISLFDTDLCIKKECHTCACGRPGSWKARDYKECLWASLPDSCEKQCPEARKRMLEDIPKKNPSEFDKYMWQRYWCSECFLWDSKTGNKIHEHLHHRLMCPSYTPTTVRTEQCLLYSMQAWDLPDGSTVKWCAICEANGCEDCYKQWEKAQEFLEEYEEES